MPLKIAIRVDSSNMIGTGHVMRCLTLAQRLRKAGAEITFICRNLFGNVMKLIEEQNFSIYVLPLNEASIAHSIDDYLKLLRKDTMEDMECTGKFLAEAPRWDWIIVDHYALDRDWESGIRNYVKKIWVIDDLANRPHNCDVLLDANYYKDMDSRYHNLVPSKCKKLLGPQYLLLREEFYSEQVRARQRTGYIKRVLVFFGGTDPTNETMKTLDAINLLNCPDIHFDIVIGLGNSNKNKIMDICNGLPNTKFHLQVSNMAQLMYNADLAIGAGGSTTWERIYIGLPALVTILADNQKQGIEELEPLQVFINLGWHEDIDNQRITEYMNKLIRNPQLVKNMSDRARELLGEESKLYGEKLTNMFFQNI